jgi:hypothetical protein
MDLFYRWGKLKIGWCVVIFFAEWLLFAIALKLLYNFFEKLHVDSVSTKILPWIFIGILLFIIWLLAFLAVYPGLFSYDIAGQLPQALYDEVPYNTHHALLHTLLCGKIIAFGYGKTGNIYVGISMYSVFQMIFCVIFFTYFLRHIYIHTGLKALTVAAFLYYAFSPLMVMYALSTTKDVICCTLLMYAVTELYELIKTLEKNKFNAVKWAVLFAALVLMCSFRKNGVPALIIFTFFIMFMLKGKQKQIIKLILPLMISAIVGYFVVNSILAFCLKADKGTMIEALSVPIQQIARVVSERGMEAFEDSDREEIEKLADEEIWDTYNPFISDNVKNTVEEEYFDVNKIKFLKIWFKYLIKYPDIYINSFLDNTYQAWYPFTIVTDKPYTAESFYYDMEMKLDLERKSFIPWLLNFYERFTAEFPVRKIPVVRMLFSTGFMLWTALTVFVYGLWSRRYEIVFPLLLVLSFCITSILGPVMLVRYFLVLFYGFPVFISWIPQERKVAQKPGQC